MFVYPKLKQDSPYQHVKLDAYDPKHPYRSVFHGKFELMFYVGEKQRRMLAYAPADIRSATAGIFVLGENGKTADDLMAHSGWCEIADSEECKEKLIVFFLEPVDGTWNTEEPYGTTDGDVAYIMEATVTASERYLFCVHESKMYLTGCREGGILANMAAVWNPAIYAGVATVGGSAVKADYLDAAGKDFCTNLNGYVDEQHRKGIRKGDIPMPAWIIDDPDLDTGTGDNIRNYWCHSCGTESQPRQLAFDEVEYYRSKEVPYILNQEKEAFRVCYSCIPGASEQGAKSLLRRIWKDFLYRQRRWMSSPGGDLRVTRDPIRDLHMEYHYEEVDGWIREWYVHIPKTVKANSQKKVPLVLALHGYTCSGEIYIGNTEWYKVADRYGFIVVFPSAPHGHVCMPKEGLDPNHVPLPAWNIFEEETRPDELKFFNDLLDRMLTDYQVDPSRIYVTGHSWGSLAVEMLALGMTKRLAAIAPCSGVFFGGAFQRMTALPRLSPDNGIELPVWMFWGTEEEWLIPSTPTHENETGLTIKMWLKKNNKLEMISENWDTVSCTVNGRFLDYSFDKEGTAPVQYTQVNYMPHATMPEMSFRIWEEFFSKYARNADGVSISIQE